MSEERPKVTFNHELIAEVFNWATEGKSAGTKPQPLMVSAELLRLFVVEMVARLKGQARVEGDEELDLKHLEMVLPQLILDFH